MARVVQVKAPASGICSEISSATLRPKASASRAVTSGSTQPSISTRSVRPVHRARAWACITPGTEPAAELMRLPTRSLYRATSWLPTMPSSAPAMPAPTKLVWPCPISLRMLS